MSYLVSGNMCFQFALANKRGTVFGTKVGVEKYPCYDIDAAGARISCFHCDIYDDLVSWSDVLHLA